jgi:hypothetical protein
MAGPLQMVVKPTSQTLGQPDASSKHEQNVKNERILC